MQDRQANAHRCSFALILNEPAGQIAIIILSYTVKLIVKAWEDSSQDPREVARQILTAFHHPFFYDDSSPIQREMGAYLKSWIDGQSHADKQFILNGLTKDAVRNHKNRRKGHEADQEGHGAHGCACCSTRSDGVVGLCD